MDATRSSMTIHVVTPDTSRYEEEVHFLLVRAIDGYTGIYPKHTPLVAALSVAPLKMQKGDTDHFLAVFGGFLEVTAHRCTIVSDHVEYPEEIDVERAVRARKRALDRLARTEDASVDRARAKAALARACTRLKAVGQMDFYAKETE